MDPAVRERISGLVDSHEVVLFMKGTRTAPQCGFSATVVQILDSMLDDYVTVDVLADPDVRQGIKDYSDWPTIPQLYVKGEFVGGCDIVKDLYAKGDLEESLGVTVPDMPAPQVTISDAAAAALQGAVQKADEFVRLEIDNRFGHSLSIGERGPKDLEVKVGSLIVLVDRGSARRAEGVSIDYVDTPNGKAFKINNPNEPPKVQTISVAELKQLLDAGTPIELFDVRSPSERQIAKLDAARLLDRPAQDHIMGLAKDTPLYFHCHHGSRSAQAAEFFLNQGFRKVFNVAGGIDAWSRDIDPDVPRY